MNVSFTNRLMEKAIDDEIIFLNKDGTGKVISESEYLGW